MKASERGFTNDELADLIFKANDNAHSPLNQAFMEEMVSRYERSLEHMHISDGELIRLHDLAGLIL